MRHKETLRISRVPELPLWEHDLVSDPGGILKTCRIAFRIAAFPHTWKGRLSSALTDLSLWPRLYLFRGSIQTLRPWSIRLQTSVTGFACGFHYWPAGYALVRWDFRSTCRLMSGQALQRDSHHVPFSSVPEQALQRGACVYMCNHPLGNNIEFQRSFASFRRFGFSSARQVPGSRILSLFIL